MDEMAQQTNDLPAGWVWTTIGEVTQQVEKTEPRAMPDVEFVYLDISSIDNFTNTAVEPKVYLGKDAPSRARQKVRTEDVLFSTVRTYLKNIALVPEQYDGQVASTGFCVLRGRPGVSGKYLFYYCLTDCFLEELGKLQRGVSYPAVRDSDVRAQLIPIAPANEQHRIVAEIETQFTRLDAGVAALKRAQAKLRRYKAAVLKAACEGRLVPTEAALARTNVGAGSPRPYEPASALLERILAERRTQWQQANPGKRYVEPKGVDADGLADLPEGWVWAKLDQLLVELKNGYFGGRPEAEPPGIPILRVSAVRPMSVSFDDPRYLLDVDETKQTAYLINEGDLFFTRYNGSRNLVGACGLVRHAPFAALYPDKLIRALVLKDLVLPGYLEAYFNTDAARDYIEGQAKTTAGQYGIAGNELRQATVALPPLSEQHRIIAEVERRLSVAQEVESTVTAGLKRAERLRQSILKRAFEGRLVPQDPSDEPATVPLERPQSLAQ